MDSGCGLSKEFGTQLTLTGFFCGLGAAKGLTALGLNTLPLAGLLWNRAVDSRGPLKDAIYSKSKIAEIVNGTSYFEDGSPVYFHRVMEGLGGAFAICIDLVQSPVSAIKPSSDRRYSYKSEVFPVTRYTYDRSIAQVKALVSNENSRCRSHGMMLSFVLEEIKNRKFKE